jgi:hypothetical protein
MAVPLCHLLAMAKAGDIAKVVLRGSTLAYYLHLTRPSSSSSTSTLLSSSEEPKMEQQQQWSKPYSMEDPRLLMDLSQRSSNAVATT